MEFMKIGRSISLAVIMIFLFSNPQESIASKNSPNLLTNKKQNNISLESIIAQRNRRMMQRPGPRGRMSGPRKRPSLNRRPQIGSRRPGNPNQGNRGGMMQRRMQRQGQPMDQKIRQAGKNEPGKRGEPRGNP